jgi:hypothetical protein
LIVERLRELLPIIPTKEYGAVKRAIKHAIAHIEELEARAAQQERHLETLRAALARRK